MEQPKIKRPALRWFGGKWRVANWIIDMMPEHGSYIEPFGGAGSVLLRKPQAPAEVYNDISADVVNFFRVLRCQPDELVRRLLLTPYARDEWQGAMFPSGDEDDVERARLFFTKCWMSRGDGQRPIPNTGWRYHTRLRNHGDTDVVRNWDDSERLFAVADRFKGVHIENLDAIALIKKYDDTNALFYIDPPYLEHANSYAGEFGAEGHGLLSLTLRGIKGKAIVSGYASVTYDALYRGWRRETHITKQDRNNQAEEVCWMNYA